MMLIIKQPETEKEFEDYYDLRWRVLRKPWNQPRDSEKDELENESFHIMACGENDNVIAVGRLHFINETEAQIRYMAVEPEHTNQGIGTLILNALEEISRQGYRTTIILDARELSVNFYEKQGYNIVKKSHVLFDSIQHYEMNKTIK